MAGIGKEKPLADILKRGRGGGGGIPGGWDHQDLASLSATPITYGVVKPGPHDDSDGVLFVRGGDFPNGKIDPSSLRTITRSVSNQYRRTQLRGGEILVSLVGYPGACAVVQPELSGANIARQAAIIRLKESAATEFVAAYLRSPVGQAELLSNILGSAQQVINLKDLRKVVIPVPPPDERDKIADILSTWDRALETVEALIANARGRRQGLLDDLLDNPEWPQRSLSSIGEISSAGVDKKSNDDERPVKLLNFVDVLRRNFIYGRSLTHWVTAPERQIAKCDVRRGDVFFTPSSETRDDIAHSAVAVEDIHEAAYSYHVVRFRLAEPWPLAFRAYAFKSKAFLRQAQALCAGSGQRYVLSQKQFGSIAVHVPPLEAQRKIGDLLRAIDQERDALIAQREALREEKAALMQQLLTGKRRVKVARGEGE